MIQPSVHATIRGAQRNLSQADIEYVLEYGTCLHRAGAIFYFMRRADIPQEDRHNDRSIRLIGTAVVVSPDDETVITVWRNQEAGFRRIKRKVRYNNPSANPFSHLLC